MRYKFIVCTVCNVTCLRCCRYVLYLSYSYCYRKSENDICFMKVHRSTTLNDANLNDANQLYPSSKLAKVQSSLGILNIAIITRSVSVFSYCFKCV